MWVLQLFSENSSTFGSRGLISYLPTPLALLPAGSTTCGQGSQALGSAPSVGVMPLLPGPWGSGLLSPPGCGPLGAAFPSTFPHGGGHTSQAPGFPRGSVPVLWPLRPHPGRRAGDPGVSVPFPLWLSSDFWLQFLASGNLLF